MPESGAKGYVKNENLKSINRKGRNDQKPKGAKRSDSILT